MATTLHVVRRVFGAPESPARPHGLDRAFVREEAAREWIAGQEVVERLRRDVNPFHFSDDMDAIATMPAEVLHDWLIDHDYPAHNLLGPLGWEDWWDAYHESFTAEQHEQLWCRLDRVRFYEVIEVPWDQRGKWRPQWVWVAYANGPPHPLLQAISSVGRTPPQSDRRRLWIRVPLVP